MKWALMSGILVGTFMLGCGIAGLSMTMRIALHAGMAFVGIVILVASALLIVGLLP